MRRSSPLRVFFFLAFAAAAAGCGGGGGGGGGGSTPPGIGGGAPTPTPAVPAAVTTIGPIQPNALPTTTGTAPPAITSSQFATGVAYGQYVYSAAGKVNFGSTNPPSTITDNDTTGITCLVYEPAGAASATPCPLSSTKSSVTLTSSNDGYAILYNGKPVPGASVNLSVSSPSTSYSVPILGTVSLGTLPFASGGGPIGALAEDPISKTVYAATGNPSTPLVAITYSATGYGAPTPINVSSVNGAPASRLAANQATNVIGGADDLVIGPDGNLWIIENNGPNTNQYVAVYPLHTAAVNPNGGPAISPATGAFGEYLLYEVDSKPLKGIASDGTYIWVIDNFGELWRIDPLNTAPVPGEVHPNLATAYAPGTVPTFSSNAAKALTMTNGTAPFDTAGYGRLANLVFVTSSGFLWTSEDFQGHIVQITRDTSPSGTGICSVGSPCLGTYTVSTSTQSCPSGIFSDGTNLYSADCGTIHVYKYALPGLSQTVSAIPFPQGLLGGLYQTSDGWFWTVTSNGAEAIPSMVAITGGVATPPNTPCLNNTSNFKAIELITGPDGSLLFSPANGGGGGTSAAVCAIVY